MRTISDNMNHCLLVNQRTDFGGLAWIFWTNNMDIGHIDVTICSNVVECHKVDDLIQYFPASNDNKMTNIRCILIVHLRSISLLRHRVFATQFQVHLHTFQLHVAHNIFIVASAIHLVMWCVMPWKPNKSFGIQVFVRTANDICIRTQIDSETIQIAILLLFQRNRRSWSLTSTEKWFSSGLAWTHNFYEQLAEVNLP